MKKDYKVCKFSMKLNETVDNVIYDFFSYDFEAPFSPMQKTLQQRLSQNVDGIEPPKDSKT